jgi:hypothetical protein
VRGIQEKGQAGAEEDNSSVMKNVNIKRGKDKCFIRPGHSLYIIKHICKNEKCHVGENESEKVF